MLQRGGDGPISELGPGIEKVNPPAEFPGSMGHRRVLNTQDPSQTTVGHPLALTGEDGKDIDLYKGAVKPPYADSPAEIDSAVSKMSPKEPHPYQSLEHLASTQTHELEQPLPELEANKDPPELDGRMIHPKLTPTNSRQTGEEQAETPGKRRTKAARDKLGSDHWTFLRDSSATDFVE